MKLVVFDVDGTLLTLGERQILDSTKEALVKLKENGYTLALASGRCYEIIDPRLLELGVFDYFITSRGAILISKDKKETLSFVPEDSIKRLYDKTIKCDGALNLWHEEGIEILYNHEAMVDLFTLFLGEEPAKEYMRLEAKGGIINGDIWIDDEHLQEYLDEFPEIIFNYAKYKQFYEFTPKGQSKAVAIEHLIKELHISKDEVVAFGDSDNDIEMVKFAGLGIVMGNGTKEIKEIADYITDAVQDHGIYNACKHFGWI